MAKIAVMLCSYHFRTKASAVSWLRGLKDMPVGTSWYPGSREYHALEAALGMHPIRHEYPVESPEYFFVSRCPTYGNTRLTAHWPYSEWPFSYKKCISGCSEASWASRAFRHEVRNQVIHARNVQDGLIIVHHDGTTFSELVRRFKEIEGISKMLPEDVEQDDSTSIVRFKDRELAHRWIRFHKEMAELSPMTEEEHLREHGKPSCHHDVKGESQ